MRRLAASALVVFAFAAGLGFAAEGRGLGAVRLVLGRSQEGRPIVAVRAGDRKGTRMLVVGCIHGTECAGVAVARALERVRARVDLWIVPDLNPDRYLAGTRQNGRGVDLNANWSSGWRVRVPETRFGRSGLALAGSRSVHLMRVGAENSDSSLSSRNPQRARTAPARV